eukprot:Gregarina_sp_Poly_1__1978@NODE_1518_length_3960_cov_101_209350_g1006_i0_p1_GENE_NODE_1518_length_3960_cov_101_209350_g1006_i0NODE_1518_length_3960_cov_101_209350_g1006_i0_p1_ORF_typecomplete_len944_score138_63zfRING_4/PF14570_6/2_7e16zfC3HC4_3/PF13920_6/1_1e06zfRING_2/PF13639_6/0_0016zfUDP/PF14569_6/0_0026zfC3HC4_2/PF13923_6/0_0038ProkRING_4/PF14447_6/0_0024ProkRING_4/PF14447_6/1_4e03zfC3HC4/PF00097_25/0_014RRM_1/PF00076_22/0_013zfRING_5/PF14634_6/0_012zfC3H1/PF10650_9/0_041zfCCCH_2/PF14608_6/0_
MTVVRQECPICFEVMDDTDLALLPCQCDYQVCLWCLQRIRQQENNKCPQCRREYDEASYRRVPISSILSRRITDDTESVASSQQVDVKSSFRNTQNANDSRRSSLCITRGEESESQVNEGQRFGKHPTICRLFNCPAALLNAQVLSQFRYLGKYGRLLSIVICTVKHPDKNTAFATFAREEDATNAQQDIAKFASRCTDASLKNIRFQIGAARHCIQALRGMTCNNEGCPFIHSNVDKQPKCFWKAGKKGPSWIRNVLAEKILTEIVQDPLKESLFTLTLPDIHKLNYGIFIPAVAIETEKREWNQLTICDRAYSTVRLDNAESVSEEDQHEEGKASRRTWQRVSVPPGNEKPPEREDPAFPALCRNNVSERVTVTKKGNSPDRPVQIKEPIQTDSPPSADPPKEPDLAIRLSFIPPPPISPSFVESAIPSSKKPTSTSPVKSANIVPEATPEPAAAKTMPPVPARQLDHVSVTAAEASPSSQGRVGMKVFPPPPNLTRPNSEVISSRDGAHNGTNGECPKNLLTLAETPGQEMSPLVSFPRSSLHRPQTDAERNSSSDAASGTIPASHHDASGAGRTPSNATTTAPSLSFTGDALAQASTAARRSVLLAFKDEKTSSSIGANTNFPRETQPGNSGDFRGLNDFFGWEDANDHQKWLTGEDKSLDFFDCLYSDAAGNSTVSPHKAPGYELPNASKMYRSSGHSTSSQSSHQDYDAQSDKYLSVWLTNLLGQLSHTQATPAAASRPRVSAPTEAPRSNLVASPSPSEPGYRTISPHGLNGPGWTTQQAPSTTSKLFDFYANHSQNKSYSEVNQHRLYAPMEDYRALGPIQHLSGPPPREDAAVSARRIQHWGSYPSHTPVPNNYEPPLIDFCDQNFTGPSTGCASNSDSAGVAFLRSVIPNATINISGSGGSGSSNSYSGTADTNRTNRRLNVGQHSYYQQSYN